MSHHIPSIGFISLGCPKALVDSERIIVKVDAQDNLQLMLYALGAAGAAGDGAASVGELRRVYYSRDDVDKGLPAKEVMALFLEKMKDGGAKPLRDWTA